MHALVRVVALIFLVPVVAVAGDESKVGANAPFDAAVAHGLLASDDAAQRRTACESLKGRWKEAAAFIPALVHALDDESEEVRRAAATTLDGMGTRAAAVLAGFLETYELGEPPLVAPLPVHGTWGSPRENPRPLAETLESLIRLGPAVTPRDTTSTLTFRGGIARRAGMAILAGWDCEGQGVTGRLPLTVLVPYATDPPTGDLATAAIALQGRAAAVRRGMVTSGTRPAAVIAWSRRLQSKRPGVRRLAALYIARWGPSTDAPIDVLGRALAAIPVRPPMEDRDASGEHDVTVCIAALRSMGTAAKSAEPEIARHAVAGHRGALGLLCRLVPIEDLKRWFPGGLPEDFHWSIEEFPSPPPELRSLLEKFVREDRELGRVRAAQFLARLGVDSAELVEFLDSKARDDERCAIAACWLTGLPESRVASLVPWLESNGSRSAVADEIDRMDARASPLGPAYVRSVLTESPLYPGRFDALLALGPAAKDAVPLLVRDASASFPFEQAPWDHRSLSLLALERIGPGAAAARGLLTRLRSDPQPWIAYLAARAERSVARK